MLERQMYRVPKPDHLRERLSSSGRDCETRLIILLIVRSTAPRVQIGAICMNHAGASTGPIT